MSLPSFMFWTAVLAMRYGHCGVIYTADAMLHIKDRVGLVCFVPVATTAGCSVFTRAALGMGSPQGFHLVGSAATVGTGMVCPWSCVRTGFPLMSLEWGE